MKEIEVKFEMDKWNHGKNIEERVEITGTLIKAHHDGGSHWSCLIAGNDGKLYDKSYTQLTIVKEMGE